jgi:hypothetical protein
LRKDEDFNREIHRLRPVFAGSRYAGALIHTARGWDAHDASGQLIGSYPQGGSGHDQAAQPRHRPFDVKGTNEGPTTRSTQRLAGNSISGLA